MSQVRARKSIKMFFCADLKLIYVIIVIKYMLTHTFANLDIEVRTDGLIRFPNRQQWTSGSTNDVNLYCKCVSSRTHRYYYVHRLIALAFVENPDPVHFNQVDHIDGNCVNNNASNLRWVSAKLNTFAARAVNASFVPRWNKWKASCTFNGRRMCLGHYVNKASASRMVRAFKEVAFNLLYLSFLTNEQRTTAGHRQYIRADESSLTVAVELLHSGIRRHRALRNQIRRVLQDYPFSATLTRLQKIRD